MLFRTALFTSIVTLTATAFAELPEPKFTAITIDNRIQIGYGVAIADVDGDGLPDVLLADKKQFAWYRNPGGSQAREADAWKKFILAENLTARDNVCIAAQDIDGDGKCEVAVGAEWNPGDTVNSGAVFYLIPPTDRTQRWEAVKLHAEPTTHRMRWVKVGAKEEGTSKSGSADQWALLVAPLHGRGNKNGEGDNVRILLYSPAASLNDPKGEWKTVLLDDSMHMTHNFDVRRDPKGPDTVVLGGKEGLITMKTGENGAQSRVALRPEKFLGAGEVRTGKLSGGTEYYTTVEPMHGNRLTAYLGTAGENASMKPVLLTDKLADGHALACGDLLGVGSDQIVIGWRGNPQQPRPVGINLFTAKSPDGEQWRESIIDENGMACEDL
ncbi:MAG: VCBS repeat-containing protein, partial [Verrucomicrobiaceae bacterium]